MCCSEAAYNGHLDMYTQTEVQTIETNNESASRSPHPEPALLFDPTSRIPHLPFLFLTIFLDFERFTEVQTYVKGKRMVQGALTGTDRS
jgi:hypothetical protein